MRNAASPTRHPTRSRRSEMISGTGRRSTARSPKSPAATTMKNTMRGCANTSSPNGRSSANAPNATPAALISPNHQVSTRPEAGGCFDVDSAGSVISAASSARARASLPARAGNDALARRPSHLHALLGEIFHGARVPGNRGVRFDLVVEREALGFLVYRHQIRFLLDHRLDDLVGHLVGQARIGDQNIPHHSILVVLVLARVDARLPPARR